MKFTGIISQVITWEQKDQYFGPWMSFRNKKYDCICIGKGNFGFQPKVRNFLSRVIHHTTKLRIVEDFPIVGDWFNIWAERPHNFKKGELVDVEVSLKERKQE